MAKRNVKILVVGSLNHNLEDREFNRQTVQTLQLFDGEKFEPLSYFDDKGEQGLSSICWHEAKPFVWYYSTGNDLRKIDLISQEDTDCGVKKLNGVHEIDFLGEDLWLSNTYFNEILKIDPSGMNVLKRIKLTEGSKKVQEVKESEINPEDTVRENSFHCNQIFETYEGELFALVHHVNGEQVIKKVAQKLIKSQGNGGVMRLKDGSTIRLKLKAPHSVRKVHGDYWVFDSGHSQLNIYSKDWKPKKTVPTSGWGRGGVWSESAQSFYAGISRMRNRYLLFKEQKKGVNMIQVFNAQAELVDQVEVPNIDQVNNLYEISDQQHEYLRGLGR
ncbi:MAG: hypothetical protein RIC95_02900 [Vicingaceae bacterium]